MENEIEELKKRVEALTLENTELRACRQEYLSAKQSLGRMSTRLRKLCKRLEPTTEVVTEMRKIADDIRDYTKNAIS